VSIPKNFQPVTKNAPCIGCHKTDYCSVSADGRIYLCRRQQLGSVTTKHDKNGTPFYVHKADGPGAPAIKLHAPSVAPDRADADVLHEVYSALLGRLVLADPHRESLLNRGLPETAINRNGYKTLPGPGRAKLARELHERFGDQLLAVPGFYGKETSKGNYLSIAGAAGIIIPCRDMQRRVAALMIRRDEAAPDQPKYLYLSSTKHGGPGPGAPVHIPIGTPSECDTLRVTEGILKADLAFELSGTATIAVPGVANWRPALSIIKALGCRTIRLAYDADAQTKPQVAQALASFFETLRSNGVAVDVESWDAQYKGIDNAIAAGIVPDIVQGAAAQEFVAGAVTATQPDKQHESTGGYFEHNGAIFRTAQTKDGPVPTAICNFTARIVEEVTRDDGAEKSMYFAIEGELVSGERLPRVLVPTSEFSAMNWVVEHWGTRAVVFAGMGNKDHLRAAIQLLSATVSRNTIYTHTGWRRIGDQWYFLHGGGAIGANGAAEVHVELPDALAGYVLPVPVDGGALRTAILASLRVMELGPPRLLIPMLAAVYRTPLGSCDFSLHLTGPTGTYKSQVAALTQQHYGAALDAQHLPGSFSSTANALAETAFILKNALFTVDDYCRDGSTNSDHQLRQKADRLFRGQGNGAARARCTADAKLRPSRPPRGMIQSTGEEVPPGQSLRARICLLDVAPGDFGPQPPAPNPKLSACQKDASAGLCAAAMAGYIHWLAPQYDAICARLHHEREQLRDQARSDGQHARTPTMVADLMVGWKYFLDFALSVGAINDDRHGELYATGWEALQEAGALQAEHIASNEPAGSFIRLMLAAIADGSAHVANEHGGAPDNSTRWGWRDGDALGRRVGWIDGNGELYIEPDAAYAIAQDFARRQNDALPISAHTLRRRLNEKGYLASIDDKRQKLTKRKVFQGVTRNVLHVNLARIFPSESPHQNETGHSGHSAGLPREKWPKPMAGNPGQYPKPAIEPAIGPASETSLNGTNGRNGRSETSTEATPRKRVRL
jgi:hypothetical protein